MNRTTFSVPKMDCAAEERLVRIALSGRPQISRIDVNLGTHELMVLHEGNADAIVALISPLNLGAEVVATTHVTDSDQIRTLGVAEEARTLKIVLAINAGMFVAEMVGAFLGDSSALLADSLDMFADAAVYGIALLGVRRTYVAQLRAARFSGVLQLLLAVGAFAEVIRRLLFGSNPESSTMITVSALALTANVTCMWLLARHRGSGAHMKASWIFTTNDVLANLGVIAAAVLIRLFESAVPDLLVATLIALVVLSGAIRILRLKG